MLNFVEVVSDSHPVRDAMQIFVALGRPGLGYLPSPHYLV
ncbi:hypothetical protein SF83666_c15000 [Sinorhizobium fredii CCBAU 83666]|nr:hypothetical protein SF83666_c15000 [Sinorhizobium fredii CCBAU 83666]